MPGCRAGRQCPQLSLNWHQVSSASAVLSSNLQCVLTNPRSSLWNSYLLQRSVKVELVHSIDRQPRVTRRCVYIYIYLQNRTISIDRQATVMVHNIFVSTVHCKTGRRGREREREKAAVSPASCSLEAWQEEGCALDNWRLEDDFPRGGTSLTWADAGAIMKQLREQVCFRKGSQSSLPSA